MHDAVYGIITGVKRTLFTCVPACRFQQVNRCLLQWLCQRATGVMYVWSNWNWNFVLRLYAFFYNFSLLSATLSTCFRYYDRK